MEISFVEKYLENAKLLKDKVVLCDDVYNKGITYGQLDNFSGRVYAYLRSKGIGKEDFVLLCLPRGIQPIIGMVGVWKNGSAFVIVEDTYAPERIEFIRKDCGCKLVIDSEVMQEIQHFEYKAGFEPWDDHAAAFAVYTSGTTGNPKGVIHEYGNINRMIDSVIMRSCDELAREDDRFALVAPLNFVASQLIILYGLYFGILNYVVPYAIVKNPLYIGIFIMKNKITGTFLTPSHIRSMKVKPSSLRFCIIGSEPANEVYMDDLIIHNFYLMSESGFAVTHFLIDKSYEFTPVGKSECGHEVLLLDENGNHVPDGEEGEICFENDFVRGYMNLPEETAKAFKDGVYHSSDLARRLPDGNIVICGRMNDMVKINGNRVEPAEIENVSKKVLGVDWTAARIIEDGKRVYVCVYYTDNRITVEFEQTRAEMEKYLPYYMLPSYFIHIDEIPLRPNGKMDRKALPAPNLDEYRGEYLAPTNDTEKALCDAFSKVLGVSRVGISDDFYQLGGDSMSSMEVIVESGLPGLSATEIFRGHTPEKIAKLYTENHTDSDGISIEEKNKEAMSKPHRLTPEQTYMVDYQFYTPKSTMYNLYSMLELEKDMLDLDTLAHAVGVAVKAHPALLSVFSMDNDGELIQTYRPELFKEVTVEHITEAELEELKKTLVVPFKIFNSCLFRCRIFETEKSAYLFMDVHHTVFDGTSSKVFFGDMMRAYSGETLETDKYYYVIDKREKMEDKPFYEESRKYFEHMYDNVKWSHYPKTDMESRENTSEEFFRKLPATSQALAVIEEKHDVTPNAFFMTAAILATAFYNQERSVMLSWIFNGRDDMAELSAVGLLFRNLPVGIRLDNSITLGKLFESVTAQINEGMEHSCYPYVEMGRSVVTDDFECVLYQDKLREMDDVPGLLGDVDVENFKAASQNVLDLEILNTADGMTLMLDYAASRYERESMERFADIFCAAVKVLSENADYENMGMKKLLRKVRKFSVGGWPFTKEWFMSWLDKDI